MISLIWAMDVNNLIGKDNDLPWHYPEDLAYFKEKTMGKKVVMGENTFYSIVNRIHKPLPGRMNVVATLNKDFTYQGVEVTYDFISYLKEHENDEEDIFVIGGKQIYALALPYAKRLYITHINKEYVGNIYFPKINYDNYDIINKKQVNELDFVIYERKF